jgi:hypothetical protein
LHWFGLFDNKCSIRTFVASVCSFDAPSRLPLGTSRSLLPWISSRLVWGVLV